MKKYILIIASSIALAISFQACRNDKVETDLVNNLFEESTASGLTFYKNGALLNGVSPSPHGAFKLRFNAIAQTVLDTAGELPSGSSFPNGSLIVKEVYSGGAISLIAIMKKDPANDYAGNGWLWAEFNPDGSTAFGIEKKGDGCISCHSGTPNRDLTRTFDLH